MNEQDEQDALHHQEELEHRRYLEECQEFMKRDSKALNEWLDEIDKFNRKYQISNG